MFFFCNNVKLKWCKQKINKHTHTQTHSCVSRKRLTSSPLWIDDLSSPLLSSHISSSLVSSSYLLSSPLGVLLSSLFLILVSFSVLSSHILFLFCLLLSTPLLSHLLSHISSPCFLSYLPAPPPLPCLSSCFLSILSSHHFPHILSTLLLLFPFSHLFFCLLLSSPYLLYHPRFILSSPLHLFHFSPILLSPSSLLYFNSPLLSNPEAENILRHLRAAALKRWMLWSEIRLKRRLLKTWVVKNLVISSKVIVSDYTSISKLWDIKVMEEINNTSVWRTWIKCFSQ